MSVIFLVIFVLFLVLIGILSIGIYLLSALLGGFANLKALFYKLTGWGRGKTQQSNTQSSSTSSASSSSAKKNASQNSSSDDKKFAQSEGTYIDFEEIK